MAKYFCARQTQQHFHLIAHCSAKLRFRRLVILRIANTTEAVTMSSKKSTHLMPLCREYSALRIIIMSCFEYICRKKTLRSVILSENTNIHIKSAITTSLATTTTIAAPTEAQQKMCKRACKNEYIFQLFARFNFSSKKRTRKKNSCTYQTSSMGKNK